VPTRQAADDAQFEELFTAHRDDLSRYVLRRYTGDAQDIVNEVFLIAWTKFSDVPADLEPQRWWLFAVARRVIANRVRWRARLDRFSVLSQPLARHSDGAIPDADAAVRRALADLNESDRELLLLVEWDGLSVDGVAQVLGLPATTVTKRLRAARERFKRSYIRWSTSGVA